MAFHRTIALVAILLFSHAIRLYYSVAFLLFTQSIRSIPAEWFRRPPGTERKKPGEL